MRTSHWLFIARKIPQHVRQVVVLLVCVMAVAGCKMGAVGQALSSVPSQSEPPVKSYDQPVVEQKSPTKDRLARALEDDAPDDGFGFE